MELNKIERLVKKYLMVKLVSKKRKSYESTASTDASHIMQYKSILDISLMRLARVPTRTCSVAKAAV
jgi:hypothetical protein